VNYEGYQGNGVIFNAGNVLALVMTQKRHQGMVISPIFVLLVPSLVSIYQMIGRMTQRSTFICQPIEMLNTDSCLHRWLYRRSIVVDGNFHADHLQMKHPEDDVAFADGLAFMVERAPYKVHLAESIETKQVSHALFRDVPRLKMCFKSEIYLP
jgi:hypothetical protein